MTLIDADTFRVSQAARDADEQLRLLAARLDELAWADDSDDAPGAMHWTPEEGDEATHPVHP